MTKNNNHKYKEIADKLATANSFAETQLTVQEVSAAFSELLSEKSGKNTSTAEDKPKVSKKKLSEE